MLDIHRGICQERLEPRVKRHSTFGFVGADNHSLSFIVGMVCRLDGNAIVKSSGFQEGLEVHILIIDYLIFNFLVDHGI